MCMVGWLPLSEPNDFTNLALQINHPRPFSSKPKTQKKKKKKRISHISLSLSLSLSVCVCVYVCMCICFLSSFLIYDSFFLSLSLSGHNNERGCDDGFVDVKSVEVSGIVERVRFTWRGDPDGLFVNFFFTSRQPVFVAAMAVSLFACLIGEPNLSLTPLSSLSDLSLSLSLLCVCVCVFWFETQWIWLLYFDLSCLVTEKVREKLPMNVLTKYNSFTLHSRK